MAKCSLKEGQSRYKHIKVTVTETTACNGHTRIVGMDPWDGLDGLGLGPDLDLINLCHDLNQGSAS